MFCILVNLYKKENSGRRTDAMEMNFHCSAQSLVLNRYPKKNRMALYSSHTSVVKRSSGQNAIASAAYNSRSKLTLYVTDKETNINYRVHAYLVAP